MATDKQQHKEEKKQLLECALPAGTPLKSESREYRITEVLGAGGFGITYKVSVEGKVGNITVKVFFVIKELFMKGCYRDTDGKTVCCAPNVKAEFNQSKRDFVTEAERLNKLGDLSPHIVKVNEHFSANNTVYYVMEYLDGGDLLHHVRKNGALTEGQALSFIIPVAKAIGHLHEDGLLHLDIKPDNIALKTDPETGARIPVLIDFGIAKHFDHNGKPTSRIVAKGASEGYAPMEQYAEITRFSPEIDIYALGATLYFCLTGLNPPKAFDISSVAELMRNLPSGVSPRVRNAISSAMQPNRFDRTQTIVTFLSAIEETYTLPIGYVLRGETGLYRIVEVAGETPRYIRYKAVRSSGNRPQSPAQTGNETPVLTQYFVYEWFVSGTDRRDGPDTLQKQAFREAGDSNLLCQKFLGEISRDASFDRGETADRDLFCDNNTCYCVCRIVPAVSRWEEWFHTMKTLPRELVRQTWKTLAISGGIIAIGYFWPEPNSEELLNQAIEQKDIKALKIWAVDSGYTRAYTALADIYLEHGYLDSARHWVTQIDTTTAEAQRILGRIRKEEEIIADSVVVDTQREETSAVADMPAPQKTDAELFREARTLADYKQLAGKGYAAAYYPLADKYYQAGNTAEAQRWAEKAIAANTQKTAARQLLEKIESAGLSSAIARKDWAKVQSYADQGKAQAYCPLAQHYLAINNYTLADRYAQKAYLSGNDRTKALEIIKVLDLYGMYDMGGAPSFYKK